ncbi:MAG: asparagine synthase (glutamine-hydrolyzing) [Myxococcaceae bacterium]|nr:asparagine synthase (glutamine-hydrolyzing) [Myxococcaceae bacterium]
MCGITAIVRRPGGAIAPGTLEAMTRDVAHRGPDGMGLTFLGGAQLAEMPEGGDWRVGLGHRRLSIIDLSTEASQPMRRGALWVTYNGEIYNYVEVRAALEARGSKFATASDTEVLLAAYEAWGPKGFERLKGMWAAVVVDARRREVVVCRDRLGIKPLYVCSTGAAVAFCSELKQLRRLTTLSADQEAVSTYLNTGYEDQRRTFFREAVPVAPGTWERWSLDEAKRLGVQPYWHPEKVTAHVDDPDEAARLFAPALRLAVAEHLRSDVPVGCALSGGLDSSALAALVNEKNPKSLETFTATFPGTPVDESAWVEKVLQVVKANPHRVSPTPQRFLEELDSFVWHHDEPVGTLSQYAGWCVARLTREAQVPVTLNGQGGDEVLNGYWQSYLVHLYGAARRLHALEVTRHVVGAALGGNPQLLWQFPVMGRRFLERRKEAKRSAASAQILSSVLGADAQARRVYEIREMYLPRLLKWDDRNFMAFSVEGRYPFLDHELIELCLSFGPRALYQRGWMKEPLRRGLEGVLPQELLRRRTKLGFEIPGHDWLHGPLRATLEALVASDSSVWELVPRALGTRALEGLAAGNLEAEQFLFRALMADRWAKRFLS